MVRPNPPGAGQQLIRVTLPCPGCRYSGMCLVQSQIEEDLTLTVFGWKLPTKLTLECSSFEVGPSLSPRPINLPKYRTSVRGERR